MERFVKNITNTVLDSGKTFDVTRDQFVSTPQYFSIPEKLHYHITPENFNATYYIKEPIPVSATAAVRPTDWWRYSGFKFVPSKGSTEDYFNPNSDPEHATEPYVSGGLDWQHVTVGSKCHIVKAWGRLDYTPDVPTSDPDFQPFVIEWEDFEYSMDGWWSENYPSANTVHNGILSNDQTDRIWFGGDTSGLSWGEVIEIEYIGNTKFNADQTYASEMVGNNNFIVRLLGANIGTINV